MKLKYELKYVSLVLVTVALIFSICIYKNSTFFAVKASPNIGLTIVIDPGHGGIDPGSIGRKTKVTESELNLKISNKLMNLLKSADFNVILTRTNSDGLYGTYSSGYKKRDMLARQEIIEKSGASLAISIHMNSFTTSANRGAQVFYNTLNKNSEILAKSIQECFTKDLPESNKGTAIGDYFILKCTEIPIVLCECGYLSNPSDEALLVTDEYQEKVAYSIYKGVVSFLSVGSSAI